MKKNPPVCPTCKTVFDPEALMKTRRRAAPEEKAKKADVAALPADDIDDIEPVGGEGEEAVIEDAAELGDEEAELEEVVEIEDDGVEPDAGR
jgi:hypothetical protein